MEIERYGIYWAQLDPVVGAEISKTRPVVIVSDNDMNAMLSTVVACPLTSALHPRWRSRIQIACGGKPAEIAVDQIRTLSRKRIRSKIDHLDSGNAACLRRLISEMYGTGA